MSDDFDVEVEARGHADEWPPWSPHHARSTREALEALLRRAMAHARREGAGEMRERAAQACTDRANALDARLGAHRGDGYLQYARAFHARDAWGAAARHIRALPLDLGGDDDGTQSTTPEET